MSTTNHDRIMQGIRSAQASNVYDMLADPERPYPACNPVIGLRTCRYCGRDMRKFLGTACPASKPSERWGFRKL